MTSIRQAPAKASGLFHGALENIVSKTKYWWLLLVTGVAWVVVGIFILRFDYTTVEAVSILFGVFCLVAAANEMMVASVSSSGWRVFRWLLAALFVVVGIVAFYNPGDTFVSLAFLMSFFFVFRGVYDIAMSFAASMIQGWWVLLIVGVLEIALGFWAAGSWKASIVLLVAWVAAGAIVYGVAQIAAAFLVRNAGREMASIADRQPAGIPRAA